MVQAVPVYSSCPGLGVWDPWRWGEEESSPAPLYPHLSPWFPLGTVPALQMHSTEFSRLSDLGAPALWFCLHALTSFLCADLPASSSFFQAQLQPLLPSGQPWCSGQVNSAVLSVCSG